MAHASHADPWSVTKQTHMPHHGIRIMNDATLTEKLEPDKCWVVSGHVRIMNSTGICIVKIH